MHPNRRRGWVQDIPDCKFVRLFPSPCTADGLVCQNIICIIGIKNQTSILHDVPAVRIAASPGNRDIVPLAGQRICRVFVESIHFRAASGAKCCGSHNTLRCPIFILACRKIGRFRLRSRACDLLSALLTLSCTCFGSLAICSSRILMKARTPATATVIGSRDRVSIGFSSFMYVMTFYET